jgi:hypothetical protein
MTAKPPFLKLRRRYEVDESYWLVRGSFSASRRTFFTLRRAALTFKWGRVPKTWELSFVDRMRAREELGLSFDEILRSVLPELFGEDTSEVLRTWIGRKARRNPERFAKNISRMFGPSARNVLGSVDNLVDEVSLLKKKAPRELPIQCLLEAIQKSDASKTVAQPVSPTATPCSGREESIQPVGAIRTDGNMVKRTT